MSFHAERYDFDSEDQQIAEEVRRALLGEDAPIDDEQSQLTLVEFDDSEKVQLDDGHDIDESYEPSASSSIQLFMRDIGKVALLTAAQEVELAKRMEAGLEAEERLARLTMKYGDNPRMQMVQQSLEKRIRDGKQAKDHMQEANLRLVVSIAKGYQGHGLSLMDLIGEGTVGLHRGVEKFDWRRGYKFSTYATWWIRQAVQRALANHSRTIRMPVHVFERDVKMHRAESKLTVELGRTPTDEEVAEETGISLVHVKEVQTARRTVSAPVALDKPVGEDQGADYGDLIADKHSEDPLEEAEIAYRNKLVWDALEQLPERERQILILRHGLEGGNETTLEEIGRQLKITRERVRQLELQAYNRIRAFNSELDPNEG